MKLFTFFFLALVSFHTLAGGPTGYGALKLGLSKQAVESLSTNDGIYANGQLTPYNHKYTAAKAGEDAFDAFLVTPLRNKPIKSVLTFKEDKLIKITMMFEDDSSVFEKVKSQITEKYGQGKVTDDRKEEQCIYKNGANFKITNGQMYIDWLEPSPEKVETRLSDIIIDTCPSNLRYSSVGANKLKTLTIKVVSESPAPAQNLF